METLRLSLSPIDGIKFRISADKYGEQDSELPFSDGYEDPNLFTILNTLNAFDPKYKFSSSDNQDWMVKEGILTEDGQFIHPVMRKNIGQKLYKSLFSSSIEAALHESLGRARSKDLHIQLQYSAQAIQTARLPLYPWQLAHNGLEFLAKRRVIFSHLVAHRNALSKGKRQVKQIKVLLISSTASEQIEERLQDKAFLVCNGLTKAEQENRARLLPWYEPTTEKPTYQKLLAYLTEHRTEKEKLPDIIHFDGHGVFKKRCNNPLCPKQDTNEIFYSVTQNRCTFCSNPLNSPEGFLLFESDNGNPEYISAETFTHLVSISQPALVVITACKSAYAHQSESVFNGVAQSLLLEVPAVVATPFNISEDGAAGFIEQFYRALGAKSSLLYQFALTLLQMKLANTRRMTSDV